MPGLAPELELELVPGADHAAVLHGGAVAGGGPATTRPGSSAGA